MTEKHKQITEGVLWKQILLFFVPIMIGSFFQQLYAIADAVVVGRGLGTTELASVGGSASKMIAMITNFFIGISTGITAYTARCVGEEDYAKLRNIVFNGFILFFSLGIVISGLCFTFSYEFLVLMGTPSDSIDLANTYLRTYLGGILFCVLYNLMTGILRAMGDAKRPLYILIFCCLLNIFLDILFALVFAWGVFGVALATVVSQGISAILLSIVFFKALEQTQKHKVSWSGTLCKSIALLGIPAGVQSMLASLSNMVVQSTVNSFDTQAVASWATYIKIDGIVDMVLSALAGTVITFVGQNLGTKNMPRVKESVKQTIILSYLIMSFLVVFFLCTRNIFLSMFTEDAEVVALGGSIMFAVIPMYLTTIPQYVLSQAVRGMGKSLVPMLLGLFGSIVLRLSWIFFLLPHYNTITFLGLSYPVISAIMSTLFVIYYGIVLKETEKNMEGSCGGGTVE